MHQARFQSQNAAGNSSAHDVSDQSLFEGPSLVRSGSRFSRLLVTVAALNQMTWQKRFSDSELVQTSKIPSTPSSDPGEGQSSLE
jgi:hypothetical protein